MANLFGDLRYVLRQLLKTPVFSLIAVLTLALGIGANTAVYSVMDAVLHRSLPVAQPKDLYYVKMADGEGPPPNGSNTGSYDTSFPMTAYAALRQRSDVFTALIGYAPLGISSTAIRVGSSPLQAEGEEVSGNFFSGVTANLALGRPLTLHDEETHSAAMVISYAFWTRQFARSPHVLGQTVFVKGIPFAIVGVSTRGFFGIEPGVSTDFWVPLQNRPELNAWGNVGKPTLYGSPNWWCLRMMARLQPGVHPQQAQAALAATFLASARQSVGNFDAKSWKPLLTFDPARGIQGYSGQLREPIEILMGLVAMVLLIAVTNVALMLLARNAVRSREFSLRLALGAPRSRLFRQLIVESALLVGSGALLGWGFAVVATQFLARMSQIETGLAPNLAVLLFTLAVSGLVALIFGIAPFRSATQAPASGVLRTSANSMTQDRRRTAAGNAVMVAQVAICLALMVAAGLLLRTLGQYQNQPLGMQADKLLIFGITPQNVTGAAQARDLYRQIEDRLSALPGVQGVTFAEERPGSGWSNNNGGFLLDGVAQNNIALRMNSLGTGYFHVVGTPMLAGREFTQADASTPALVAVVNQTFAQRLFPHGSPIGHHIGSGDQAATIIGVVADSRYTSVDEAPQAMAYVDVWQAPDVGALTVIVRTTTDPMALLDEARKAVRSVNPNLPLETPMTQLAQFQLSYAQPTMFATLGGFFGGLAGLLVAIGLYGTLSYRTGQRRTEIGIRMALGSSRAQVIWLVLRESLLVMAVGLVVGIPITIVSTHVLSAMLWHLSPYDRQSIAFGIAGVLVVVIAASLIPARRAASVDPAIALRAD